MRSHDERVAANMRVGGSDGGVDSEAEEYSRKAHRSTRMSSSSPSEGTCTHFSSVTLRRKSNEQKRNQEKLPAALELRGGRAYRAARGT
jgi:hypothetical protein